MTDHAQTMMEKNRGFTRVAKAAYYSYKGLSYAWRNEAAFRQEAMAAMLLIPLALWLDVSRLECILLVASVVFVIIVELLNTGIEAVVDRVGYERHELAGVAKDMGSAAVLVAIVLGFFVWLMILVPHSNWF